MFSVTASLTLLLLLCSASAQQIFDTYTTTLDQKSKFVYKNLGSKAINFTKPGNAGDAKITFTESKAFQPMVGFGATLTDTAANSLVGLKKADKNEYDTLMNNLFNAKDDERTAGLSYLRVSLGASDLSPSEYTFNDKEGDTKLSTFSLAKAGPQLEVIKDALAINKAMKLHLVPWSPPAWMKDSKKMGGGDITSKFYDIYANYLFKAISGYQKALGTVPYSIAIQNEPQNGDKTYPTATMSVDDDGQIATKLRALLDKDSGLKATKIIGFEHNWSNVAKYPVPLIQKYGKAFAGVSFHCYAGSFKNQAEFSSKFPDKEIYHTECTGTIGSSFSDDVQWWMDNLFIGSIEFGARSAMMWNLAGPSDGSGLLPGTSSCGKGCRPVVGIDNGKFTLNQEYFAMGQAQKAINPVDENGPTGVRVQTSISGKKKDALRVIGFDTGRANADGQHRYSLMVMNWRNADSVKTTINFRGLEATYDFPVGVTTLSWFAEDGGKTRREVNQERTVDVFNASKKLPPTKFKRMHGAHRAGLSRVSH